MAAIVGGSLKDMFTLVNTHLRSINRSRILPAGIVITGGGSGLTSVSDVARMILKLPSQIGQIGPLSRAATVDATWTVAYGLCRWAYAEDASERTHSFSEVIEGWWESLKSSVRSLLP